MDVILVPPPIGLEERYGSLKSAGSSLPPLGTALLSAILKKNGVSAMILDAGMGFETVDEVVDALVARQPSIVGFSSVTCSIIRAAKIIKRLKQKDSSIKIIIGGVHFSSLPVKTMQEIPGIDIGVIGECDTTIALLIKKIITKEPIHDIPNIVYKEDNRIIFTEEKKTDFDLDDLPIPDYEGIPSLLENYAPALTSLYRLPSTSFISSRGCNGKCIFCDRTLSANLRTYSADYIIEVLKYLKHKYGIKDIVFHDDNFLINPNRTFDLCQKLRKYKLNISFSFPARIDMINKEVLAELKSAGCWQIAYGIESGSQKILNFLKKGLVIEDIKEKLALTHKAGIENRAYFMIGMPTETKTDIEETYKFLMKNPINDFHVSYFTPYPGTKIYRNISNYGKFFEDYEKMTGWNIVFIPKDLTEKDLLFYQKRMIRDFYFRTKTFIRYISRLRYSGYRKRWITAMKMMGKV